MGMACGTHGSDGNAYQQQDLRGLRHRWEENVKKVLKETRHEFDNGTSNSIKLQESDQLATLTSQGLCCIELVHQLGFIMSSES